jgi:hypothetical protein
MSLLLLDQKAVIKSNYAMSKNQVMYVLLILALSGWTGVGFAEELNPGKENKFHDGIGSEDLFFIENKGQVADVAGKLRPDILFVSKRGSTTIYITSHSIHYQFSNLRSEACTKQSGLENLKLLNLTAPPSDETMELDHFELNLDGSSLQAGVSAQEALPFFENYYLAHCPNGILGARSYKKIVISEVYPGIDWVIYANNKALKYDFVVHPGADPGKIKLRLKGGSGIKVDEDGTLIIQSKLGRIVEDAPISFCGKERVETAFTQIGPDCVGFKLGSYNTRNDLRIDPSVAWATYYGGIGVDAVYKTTTDNRGNVYIAGSTLSNTGISTSNGFQFIPGGARDGFFAKFNSAGTRLWATYYGGTSPDYCTTCFTDSLGNIIVAGSSASTGLATAGAFKTAPNSDDGFLGKFDSSGARLWSTYFGALYSENVSASNFDSKGNIYITGVTGSLIGLSTTGAHQTSMGNSTADAFLAKFSSTGQLKWSTYYGGNDWDQGIGCMADSSDNIYMVGATLSTNAIATTGSHQSSYGGGSFDMFLVKFDSAGVRQWGTYYGGSGSDKGYNIALDRGNNLYVVGVTSSSSGIATTGSMQASLGGGDDAFLVKFSRSGVRIWSTYYGGSAADNGFGCLVDSRNNLYLCGNTLSASGIATAVGFQTSIGGNGDIFLARFDTSGARVWGTYYGAAGDDATSDFVLSPLGGLVVAGTSTSTSGIATSGSHQSTNGGAGDALLVRILDGMNIGKVSGSPFCAGASIVAPVVSGIKPNAGNTFTAQLSDASGSFSSPTTIGALLSATNLATINCTLPSTLLYGSGYRVRVIASSPSDTSDNISDSITINVAPIAPAIAFNNDSLRSDRSPVQWYGPSGMIPSITSASFKPTAPGNYYAVYIDSNGCSSGQSNMINLTPEMLGVNSDQFVDVNIFPNPSRGVVNIELSMANVGTVDIYDIRGVKIVSGFALNHTKNSIDISEYKGGTYLIIVRTTNGRVKTSKLRLER